MGLFSRVSIRARVLETIDQRINEGQQEYDGVVETENRNLAEGVRALTDACARNKEVAVLDIVKKIVG